MWQLALLLIGLMSTTGLQAESSPAGDTGKWDFYQRGDASEHYAQLDANSSEQFQFGAPQLVLYCIQNQGSFGIFVSWNQFIDSTIHPIRLKVDQQPTLLMSRFAGVEGENSWLPAGRFTNKVSCDEDNCTGPGGVSMTRLDLIGKMLGAQDISVETTDSDGKPWSAVFTLTRCRQQTISLTPHLQSPLLH